jgi:hypothetical protein
MLGEFPGNTLHFCWTPGKHFPALTEELDKRIFLCGTEVDNHEGRFLQVGAVNLNFSRILGGVESLIRHDSLCCWQHIVIGGNLELSKLCFHPERLGDLIELLVTCIGTSVASFGGDDSVGY